MNIPGERCAAYLAVAVAIIAFQCGMWFAATEPRCDKPGAKPPAMLKPMDRVRA